MSAVAPAACCCRICGRGSVSTDVRVYGAYTEAEATADDDTVVVTAAA